MCHIPLDPDVDKRTRALSAEQAIKAMNLNFSCRNGKCTFYGPKRDLEEHEETCEYDPQYEDVDDSEGDSNQSEDSSDSIWLHLAPSDNSSDDSGSSSGWSISTSEIEDLERDISETELERIRQQLEAMRTTNKNRQH